MNLPSSRRIRADFESLSATYARLTRLWTAREVRGFARWINPRRADRALDAASGPGALAHALAPRVARVVRLDLCPQMLRLTPPRHARDLTALLVAGDVARLPCGDGRFDLVTCTYSFANFPRPAEALNEFRRVTRPGGRIAVLDVVAPERASQRAYLNRLESLRNHFGAHILARSGFLRLFSQARLRVEKCEFHRRSQKSRPWLRLSPAAADPSRAGVLRRLLADSIPGDKAGLRPRRCGRDIVFHYTTAWFLLRRPLTPIEYCKIL